MATVQTDVDKVVWPLNFLLGLSALFAALGAQMYPVLGIASLT
jgi:hypothetical protein